MSDDRTHDQFCPWVDDPARGPRDRCAWCDRLTLARADATMIADQMLTEAQWLADESQQALKAAIDIILELRTDVTKIATDLGAGVKR